MTRFLDSLSGTLAGLLIGVLLMAVIVPQPFTWASRPALQATPPHSHGGMTTEGPVSLPSPDCAGRTETPSPMTPAVVVPKAVGVATWFNSPAGVSAAGPDLRAELGPGWRGMRVRVCSRQACVTTILGDWMRADKLIDLHAPLFRAVCGPLSRGICRVEVSW